MDTASLVQMPPQRRYAEVSDLKAEGAHYTPRRLADFVASQIISTASSMSERPTILDPALGDGELVLALLATLQASGIEQVEVYGFETSANALHQAEARIRKEFPNAVLRLTCGSFLDFVLRRYRQGELCLFTEEASALANLPPTQSDERQEVLNPFSGEPPRFDFVIANPPYVRTQVMGAKQAQQLSRQFNLSGRIDLYHAFLLAVAEALKPNGIVGIIVSNRFMTTKSGAAVRHDIVKQFHIHHIWDLGDTKLFTAAVLPAVLLLEKKGRTSRQIQPRFTSIYSSDVPGVVALCGDVIEGLSLSGQIEVQGEDRFFVAHGLLEHGGSQTSVWRMKTETSTDWLATVQAHTWATFGDIGKIRVGVKTTADKVFIRSDWECLPENVRPELLKPLITHHIARRFRSLDVHKSRKILYPHHVVAGQRRAVSLNDFPRTARYLEQHRKVLEGRTYVTEGGRNWYEIWVPQDPAAWASPKLVFRDISEQPTFWIDLDGCIVNGDCYWLPCPDAAQENLLWLALVVGNSTFSEAFYDCRFHNKLYSGRRRFITQYVEHFPLPDPTTALSQRMIEIAKRMYADPSSPEAASLEQELDGLTWQSFGLSIEERTW